MGLPLVVGVDGSDAALRAVDWAADEAARLGRPLRLVNASLWERYEGVDTSPDAAGRPLEQRTAERVTARAAERARARRPAVAVSAEVLAEDPETALLREGENAYAVVTGSRGRGGIAGLLLGSVSLAVAARAACPVVVVRDDGGAGGSGRVVLGVSGEGGDEAAAEFAFRAAEARGGALHAVHARRHPAAASPDVALDAALGAPSRAHSGVEVHRRLYEGPARKALVEASAGADLLVVGARRSPGPAGLLGPQLGPVAHTALHHATCPVAVVPHR